MTGCPLRESWDVYTVRQRSNYVLSGSIPNPTWELIVHLLPTNVFLKSDGPRLNFPLVEPARDGDGTAGCRV